MSIHYDAHDGSHTTSIYQNKWVNRVCGIICEIYGQHRAKYFLGFRVRTTQYRPNSMYRV
jgi:hypothetical protein